jgi:hypothetical protein
LKEDVRIFLKYVFNPKGFLESIIDGIRNLFKPTPFSSIVLLFALVALLKYEKPKSFIITLVCLSVALFIQLNQIYKSGEHRAWYRQSKGIKSKKQLIREEFEKSVEKEGIKEGEKNKVEKV